MLREIGAKFEFGDRVVLYVDEADQKPSVETASGKTYVADDVVAAGGPRSIARQQVLGLPDTKVNSGYAIFRAHFDLTVKHKKNQDLAGFCDPTTDMSRLWVTNDLHMIVYTWNKGKDIGWVLAHKKDDVLACLDQCGFEKKLVEVVKATPDENLGDYELVWRDPLKT